MAELNEHGVPETPKKPPALGANSAPQQVAYRSRAELLAGRRLAVATHLDAGDVGNLTPEEELEEIEIGFGASYWLLLDRFVMLYHPDHRVHQMSTNLFAKVAQATSQLGLPFPEHWWPPSVDREVLDEINSRAQDRS